MTAESEAVPDALGQLIKTDSYPRVRQRAPTVLLVEQGHTLASVGRLLGMARADLAAAVRRSRRLVASSPTASISATVAAGHG
jgi:hypothetical protein